MRLKAARDSLVLGKLYTISDLFVLHTDLFLNNVDVLAELPPKEVLHLRLQVLQLVEQLLIAEVVHLRRQLHDSPTANALKDEVDVSVALALHCFFDVFEHGLLADLHVHRSHYFPYIFDAPLDVSGIEARLGRGV